MKILLANRNRDFLRSYAELFDRRGDVVTCAFDGAQTVIELSAGEFDCAVIDASLPRVDCDRVVRAAELSMTRAVVLYDSPTPSGVPASARRLAYPFTPDELFAAVDSADNPPAVN